MTTYDAITEMALIRQRLEQMEKDRKADAAAHRAALEALTEKITEQNGRVDSLESSRDWMKGAIGVLVALVVPVLIGVAIYLITNS